MKIKVLKTFKATPVGFKKRFSYDPRHVFEVGKVGKNDVLLIDIHGGRDLRITKDFYKHLEEGEYIKKEGEQNKKHRFSLNKGGENDGDSNWL